MPVLQGNTSGSILGTRYNIPSTIKSIILTNKTGGTINVNVQIVPEFTLSGRFIAPINKQITAYDSYVFDTPIRVLSGYTIYITTSGSLDYYVQIESE